MSHDEPDINTINGTPRSTVMALDEEGPRLGKSKLMSPKKVTNKRSGDQPMFSNKLEKLDDKENTNIGNLVFPKHDLDESGL